MIGQIEKSQDPSEPADGGKCEVMWFWEGTGKWGMGVYELYLLYMGFAFCWGKVRGLREVDGLLWGELPIRVHTRFVPRRNAYQCISLTLIHLSHHHLSPPSSNLSKSHQAFYSSHLASQKLNRPIRTSDLNSFRSIQSLHHLLFLISKHPSLAHLVIQSVMLFISTRNLLHERRTRGGKSE